MNCGKKFQSERRFKAVDQLGDALEALEQTGVARQECLCVVNGTWNKLDQFVRVIAACTVARDEVAIDGLKDMA